MSNRIFFVIAILPIALVAIGCGSSTPPQTEKPLSAPPTTPNQFQSLKTPEEKIKFIEESKAPESEKKKAIEKIRAGQL